MGPSGRGGVTPSDNRHEPRSDAVCLTTRSHLEGCRGRPSSTTPGFRLQPVELSEGGDGPHLSGAGGEDRRRVKTYRDEGVSSVLSLDVSVFRGGEEGTDWTQPRGGGGNVARWPRTAYRPDFHSRRRDVGVRKVRRNDVESVDPPLLTR